MSYAFLSGKKMEQVQSFPRCSELTLQESQNKNILIMRYNAHLQVGGRFQLWRLPLHQTQLPSESCNLSLHLWHSYELSNEQYLEEFKRNKAWDVTNSNDY